MLGTIVTYLGLFAIESYAIIKIYDASYQYLNKNWEPFQAITPPHKKWYVLSNYIKSAGLACFAPFCSMVLYDNVFHNDWNNTLVLHLGCMYSVLDFTSVLKVPKLAKNTIYHHIAVNLLYFYTLTNGMHVDSFSRLIVVYAVFSTLAFPVNSYLATRVVTKNELFLKTFSSFAFVNYVACCSLNWSYQLYHLAWRDHFLTEYGIIPIVMFTGLIFVVMADDIILIMYLRDHSFFDWLKPELPSVIEKTILIFQKSTPDQNITTPTVREIVDTTKAIPKSTIHDIVKNTYNNIVRGTDKNSELHPVPESNDKSKPEHNTESNIEFNTESENKPSINVNRENDINLNTILRNSPLKQD